MNRYEITGTVYLDFITSREQETLKFTEKDAHLCSVLFDDKKSFLLDIENNVQHEAINYAWVIQKYIDDGALTLE